MEPSASKYLDALGSILEEKYGLLEAHVVFSPTPDYAGITHDLSRYGAEYMHETVKDGDIVGVSWGTTMYQIAIFACFPISMIRSI